MLENCIKKYGTNSREAHHMKRVLHMIDGEAEN